MCPFFSSSLSLTLCCRCFSSLIAVDLLLFHFVIHKRNETIMTANARFQLNRLNHETEWHSSFSGSSRLMDSNLSFPFLAYRNCNAFRWAHASSSVRQTHANRKRALNAPQLIQTKRSLALFHTKNIFNAVAVADAYVESVCFSVEFIVKRHQEGDNWFRLKCCDWHNATGVRTTQQCAQWTAITQIGFDKHFTTIAMSSIRPLANAIYRNNSFNCGWIHGDWESIGNWRREPGSFIEHHLSEHNGPIPSTTNRICIYTISVSTKGIPYPPMALPLHISHMTAQFRIPIFLLYEFWFEATRSLTWRRYIYSKWIYNSLPFSTHFFPHNSFVCLCSVSYRCSGCRFSNRIGLLCARFDFSLFIPLQCAFSVLLK